MGHDNNSDRNLTTITLTPKIEALTLGGVYKLTYSILNVLGNLFNLQNVCIYLSMDYIDDNELLVTSDNVCSNADLCGILKLLRKASKLRKVVLKGVVSSGNHIPSHHLKKTLAEQQKNNLQLRKCVVIPTYRKCLMDTENLFEIINLHFK